MKSWSVQRHEKQQDSACCSNFSLMAVQFCCNCNYFLKTFLHYFMDPISCLVIPMWTTIVVKGLAAPSVPLFVMAAVNCLFIWILLHASELELCETECIVLVHCHGTLITSEIAYIHRSNSYIPRCLQYSTQQKLCHRY